MQLLPLLLILSSRRALVVVCVFLFVNCSSSLVPYSLWLVVLRLRILVVLVVAHIVVNLGIPVSDLVALLLHAIGFLARDS